MKNPPAKRIADAQPRDLKEEKNFRRENGALTIAVNGFQQETRVVVVNLICRHAYLEESFAARARANNLLR
jgi:hypothetical protein